MRNCAQVGVRDKPLPVPQGGGGDCARFLRRLALHLPHAALSIALLGVQVTQAWAEDDIIDSHKRDLADIEQRVRDLEQDLSDRRGNRAELLKELEQRERDIADLARAGHDLEAMIHEQELVLEKLRGQLTGEREALNRERITLGKLLRSAYAMGGSDPIRMLLDQEDASRLSRVMAYYGFLNRFQMTRIEAIVRQARRLSDLAREAEGEKTRLVVLAQKQEETRARLAAAQEERSGLLAAMERGIDSEAENIENLRAQGREMRSLLEQLERQARVLPEAELRQEPLSQLRGRLSWPLADASLVTHFGSPKGDGSQHWDGVILGAREGSEVRAVHAGRVAYADWLRGFGLLLIIEHDDDYMTLYGHNQTLLKEPGEWVAAGEIVALSGSSGGRKSPGLYFAIRHRGQPLNPEQWCGNRVESGRKSSATDSSATEHAGDLRSQTEELRRQANDRIARRASELPIQFHERSP